MLPVAGCRAVRKFPSVLIAFTSANTIQCEEWVNEGVF
jgi:hypothetical protein